MTPGYYDVWFWQETTPVVGGPTRRDQVAWPGARVLMLDDNGDAIVEHYPEGWAPGVGPRRIDRIPASWIGTAFHFTPVDLPAGA